MVRWIALLSAIAVAHLGCHEKSAPVGAATRAVERSPRVASLVPAATDLIIGMGAGNHLVAVSNYDSAEVGSRELPRVGDYAGTDWETLATLRPAVMVIQMAPSRLPEGFRAKVDRLGIRLVNVRIDTLEDLLGVIQQLGDEVGEKELGAEFGARLRKRLDALRERSAGKVRTRTLLALDEEGKTLVGPGSFLDDLLTLAGGENAAASLGSPWPAADAETLSQLRPEVVILLKPNGNADALDRTTARWHRLGAASGGPAPRVRMISDAGVLLPGAHVAEVAEAMYRCMSSPEGSGR